MLADCEQAGFQQMIYQELVKTPRQVVGNRPTVIFEKQPDITFVCCIDSGWLEAQTLRMLESLRRWGGRFANARVIAVTPRFGCPLSKRTHRLLEKLNVEYLRFQADHPYTWLSYVNKPQALAAVEKISNSEFICWLDSDLLIVGEPEDLILEDDIDFAACATFKDIATSGPGDEFEPYWQAICQTLGIDIETLPWVLAQAEDLQIRLLWNSGMFVYRRNSNFGQHYLDICLHLLDSRLVPNTSGLFAIGMNEMIAVGLAMVKQNLPWKALSMSYNFSVNYRIKQPKWFDVNLFSKAKIIHYHDSMLPQHWDKFLTSMQYCHPEVAEWLSQSGPMTSFAAPQWRLISKVLEGYRSQKHKLYRKSCIAV
jgi:hypothetical protein